MPSEAEVLVAGTDVVTVRQESESSGVFIVSVEDLVMVGCGMRERGIAHDSIYNLSEWVSGDAKKPSSRRLTQRSVD